MSIGAQVSSGFTFPCSREEVAAVLLVKLEPPQAGRMAAQPVAGAPDAMNHQSPACQIAVALKIWKIVGPQHDPHR
eukprot:CAMPEP_0206332082 /NCGR_PEP_ID=MMETSP0106_2-20121207/24587_1 /ASSEMBLY_ACC=CAM_ASM_000206 /TAXON_ID=81532 /ORGANISM="Acanthoeca-like sp., Strain 10tr" /LENGTH=75 /DNA_ID=CAMNT_0053764933 /DNA_START=22 /DNA_END=249 /DNA_ORIENTATION=+